MRLLKSPKLCSWCFDPHHLSSTCTHGTVYLERCPTKRNKNDKQKERGKVWIFDFGENYATKLYYMMSACKCSKKEENASNINEMFKNHPSLFFVCLNYMSCNYKQQRPFSQ